MIVSGEREEGKLKNDSGERDGEEGTGEEEEDVSGDGRLLLDVIVVEGSSDC